MDCSLMGRIVESQVELLPTEMQMVEVGIQARRQSKLQSPSQLLLLLATPQTTILVTKEVKGIMECRADSHLTGGVIIVGGIVTLGKIVLSLNK